MFQNLEFIKNRSFEIAWAVFRCAALVKQDNLKKNLEDGAVNLVNKYGHSDLKNDVVKNVSEIERLTSLIRLAETIGEIKIVNARVLYRELSNLHDAVKRHEKLSIKQVSQNPEETVFIESIFSQPPMVVEEVSVRQSPLELVRQSSPQVIRQSADNSAMPIGRQAKKSKENKSSAISQPESSAIVTNSRQSPQVIRQNSPTVRQEPAQTEEESVQDSWQNLIYRKIKEFGKVSTREIAEFFPEISERTIRFYLQRLNDAGLIEKIGISGPGSSYIVKK